MNRLTPGAYVTFHCIHPENLSQWDGCTGTVIEAAFAPEHDMWVVRLDAEAQWPIVAKGDELDLIAWESEETDAPTRGQRLIDAATLTGIRRPLGSRAGETREPSIAAGPVATLVRPSISRANGNQQEKDHLAADRP